jgi:hypothetical protein
LQILGRALHALGFEAADVHLRSVGADDVDRAACAQALVALAR